MVQQREVWLVVVIHQSTDAGSGHEDHGFPVGDRSVDVHDSVEPVSRVGPLGPTPSIQEESGEQDSGWKGRPVLSKVLRAAAWLVPLGVSVAVAAVLSRTLPSGGGWTELMRIVVTLAISTVVLFAVSRLTRRLLPLAMLLQMSLVFPDKVPARFSVAIRAGSVKRLTRAVTDAADASDAGGTNLEALSRVLILLGALARHDPRTRGHSERVSAFNDLIAEELGLSPSDRDKLRWAALLHDIGKLHVHTRILNKSGKPTDAEWRALMHHPEIGARIVAPLRPWLGDWVDAVGQHHERFDGHGYPNGLADTEISLAARIVAVADAFEVMTALRSYKRPVSARAAREELVRCAGTHFDPRVVRAFLNISIGKVRSAMGPLSWIAQMPFLGGVPQLQNAAIAVTRQALVSTGTLTAASVMAMAGTIAAQPPSPAAATSSSTAPSTLVTNARQGSFNNPSAASSVGSQAVGHTSSTPGLLGARASDAANTPGDSGPTSVGFTSTGSRKPGTTRGRSTRAPGTSTSTSKKARRASGALGQSGSAPPTSGKPASAPPTTGNSGSAPGTSISTSGNPGVSPVVSPPASPPTSGQSASAPPASPPTSGKPASAPGGTSGS